jgi:hypothetical protein
VLISRNDLLTLEQIAKLWAEELRGTQYETSAVEIGLKLVNAVYDDELVPIGPPWEIAIASPKPAGVIEVEWSDTYKARRQVRAILALKLTRSEFLRWCADKGYPQPAFWGVEPAPSGTPPAQESSQPHKKRGPTTQPTKAPTVKVRQAPVRNRVKGLMRADIKADKVTIDDLRKNKESWAEKYKTSPTTAYEAAVELEEELNQQNNGQSLWSPQSLSVARPRATNKQ